MTAKAMLKAKSMKKLGCKSFRGKVQNIKSYHIFLGESSRTKD